MMINTRLEPIEILIIEDNPGDVILLLSAFKSSKMVHNIKVANDGLTALSILNKIQENKNPDLILLDLNLPDMEGHEILKYVKNNPKLKRIPVMVMSSSAAQSDIEQAYDNYVSGYFIKPTDHTLLEESIHTIEKFWFSLVELPHK